MITQIIGYLGMIMILLAFIMDQFNIWKSHSTVYDSTNAIAAILLIIYAWSLQGWPFIIVSILWAIVAFRGIIKYWNNHKTTKKPSN